MTPLLVLVGGAVGAPARYLLDRGLTRWWGRPAGLPVGILVVNVLGSLALGLLVGFRPAATAMALLGTGFCGAFTTWSTLALEVYAAGRRREMRAAALNLALSLVLGVGAGWAGLLVAGSAVS